MIWPGPVARITGMAARASMADATRLISTTARQPGGGEVREIAGRMDRPGVVHQQIEGAEASLGGLDQGGGRLRCRHVRPRQGEHRA